jgi:sec-independent protein translocase protein TatB
VFNVGGPEIVVILLVALVILGPDQLPKAMRTFGNVMAEIRKVSGGFQDEMRKAMDTLDTTGSDKATKADLAKTAEVTGSAADKAKGVRAVAARNGRATTPAEADVTEVVARNNGAPSDGPAAAVDPSDRPAIDPADRAAG